MKDRNLLMTFCALALAAGACTLPADDAGTMTWVDEGLSETELARFQPDTGAANPELPVIECAMRVDYPHRSSHDPSKVNVVAGVECNIPVAAITITLTLERNGVPVVSWRDGNVGKRAFKTSVAAPCANGLYQGAANATVTAPPRYDPKQLTRFETSGLVFVDCAK